MTRLQALSETILSIILRVMKLGIKANYGWRIIAVNNACEAINLRIKSVIGERKHLSAEIKPF